MYSSTDDSGRPANSARITWPSLREEQLLHLAARHGDDLAHVAGALVLAVARRPARPVRVRERGGVGHRRDRQRLDPVGVVAAERPRHPGAGVVADDVERVEPERVGHAEHVAGELVHRERGDVVDARAGRVAPLGERDGVVAGGGERVELRDPARRGLRDAVQQDHRAAVGAVRRAGPGT